MRPTVSHIRLRSYGMKCPPISKRLHLYFISNNFYRNRMNPNAIVAAASYVRNTMFSYFIWYMFFLYFIELVSRAKYFLSSCERFHVLVKLMKISPISLHMIIRCYVLIMYSPKCARVHLMWQWCVVVYKFLTHCGIYGVGICPNVCFNLFSFHQPSLYKHPSSITPVA